MVSLLFDILFCIGWIGFMLFARQLYRWERQLKRARVAVSFKGKRQMTPRLIDLLVWATRLEGDKKVNGQVIYKQGGTTIALLKPLPKEHGKTTTKTIREGEPAR